MKVFERLESEVRGYCRSFPVVFTHAEGDRLIDEDGKEYIDFFAGAGALNYGHNPAALKSRLISYLAQDGITHGLDMATAAKRDLLLAFEQIIMQPRKMDYKIMFPGPTGTNAVEAALKLARKVTGRQNVVSFTNGFHGMTLGSLALTGNSEKRAGAGVSLNCVTHMPFCDYLGTDVDSIDALGKYLQDSSSGMDLPAAIVLETVQAEGGVNVASKSWLQGLSELARKFDALLIVDDIQVGCGRTGPFFSFDAFDLRPDIICLSKSLSGYGLPLSMLLFKREFDAWKPGEHNGTFRGNNPAFVTATAALQEFWRDDKLSRDVERKALTMRDGLLDLAETLDADVSGRGLIQGIRFNDPAMAGRVANLAFHEGLIIETCGPRDEVLKCLPPLTVSDENLMSGLQILANVIGDAANVKVSASVP